MDITYITKLQEQPLVVDLSEDYFEGGRFVHRPDFHICWDGRRVPNRWGDTVWRYKSVRVAAPLSYEAVIAAIVRSRYSADEVEAILLNAQLQPEAAGEKAAEYRQELEELQAWRAEAKRIAECVLAAKDDNE